MFPHRYAREENVELTSCRPGSCTRHGVRVSLPIAVAAGLALLGVGSGASPARGVEPLGAGTVHQLVDTTRKADTVKAGDRRCLTSRPGEKDCLPRPVPADEPHGAVCGMCHDLWKSQPVARSVRSCTDGACHARAETLTPFHRTVDSATLSHCTSCHLPHSFRVTGNGEECKACHRAGGALPSWVTAPKPLTLPSGSTFSHDQHATVACGACHGSGPTHATLKLSRLAACRSCHHSPPLSKHCTRCHAVDEVRATSYDVTTTLNVHVGSLNGPVRTLHFDHAKHWQTDCTVCHTGVDMTAKDADCSTCHFEHHQPTANCAACHDAPKPGAHTRTVHTGCGGPGCHQAVPVGIRDVPRTRQICLACHRTMAGHEPDRNCADCHSLPPVPATGVGS